MPVLQVGNSNIDRVLLFLMLIYNSLKYNSRFQLFYKKAGLKIFMTMERTRITKTTLGKTVIFERLTGLELYNNATVITVVLLYHKDKPKKIK